jgi:predicted DNA-binding transcriptional regulator AlpA
MLDSLTLGQKSNTAGGIALCKLFSTSTPRFAMDHSAPILANYEALPDILTPRDLEKFLQIDVKTIYSYVQRGLIPYVRIQSNVRFLKHQILQWLAERNYQPRPLNGKRAKRQ